MLRCSLLDRPSARVRALLVVAGLLAIPSSAAAQQTGMREGEGRGDPRATPVQGRSIHATPPNGVPAGAPPLPDTTVQQQFDVPAQPLPDALGDFARQAGVQVRFDAASATSVRSAPVSGRLTPVDALRRLLAGTGYTGRFTDERNVVVTSASGRDTSAQALERVVVTGTAARRPGYGVRRTTTATKTDTPLRDTPQTVTVVTHELIADQAMQSMADVVRYIPGVTMGQGEGHRDAPTIRGNSSTADFFVDGVRDDAQYLRDLYNADRVEALKGANALTFGRGGGGGVINRVTKEAQWAPTRTLTLEGGSYEHKRASIDVGQGLGRAVAARLNGVYEKSDLFRDATGVTRYGVNPTVAIAAGPRTMVRLGYEHFDDERTVDRGIPSFQGRPADADVTTFFGNPELSRSQARVHAAGATIEHATPFGLTVRNRTRFVRYDKFYRNVYPGAVDGSGTQVSLAAYDNATERDNLFNQTELTYELTAGSARHTLLLGVEVGRQATDNFRRTGYFEDATTSLLVSLDRPTVATPVTFRQSATDADNHVTTNVAGAYAQHQVELSPQWQAIIGLRYERFDLAFRDNRNGEQLERADEMLSPRAGLVFKPVEPVSVYGSYAVSHLPSAGDQFSSLTATSRTLEPERFANYELGAKWDVRPDLALTTALYRLDRTNTSAPDPTEAGRIVQTGSQRTTGFEFGVTGSLTSAWQVAGGYASQRATIRSATTAAAEGATVPLVPRQTVSLWNRYQLVPAWGIGLGVIHQADMYSAIDNAVTLPGFTRVDGAVYFALGGHVRAQVNLENLLDERYYGTSHGNNNIMPGAPRTVRVSLTTGF